MPGWEGGVPPKRGIYPAAYIRDFFQEECDRTPGGGGAGGKVITKGPPSGNVWKLDSAARKLNFGHFFKSVKWQGLY